ncbi:hypothetical protein IL38_14590 [Actinopolyspora erythraea]|uniref:Secreted protein n=1 Tax=Actinopolyspora erythraea TaxID=414996 RepID=A0ABR4X3D5_9ACTN|nr:hypothetical protein [Actinopolyspora erythraea]KGI80983.1 hypothetical protein IL38_14590 [Actinopolyspora erythraea]
MSRLFWLGAGVAAGVALSRKVNRTARRATPTGMADQLGDAVRELAEAVGSFGADVRAGMSERERELHESVTERTGVVTGGREPRAVTLPDNGNRQVTRMAGTLEEAGSHGRRARRAGR